MLHDMTTVGIPYAEKALRTVVVYLVIVVLLRFAGKRDLAQVNTFDLVVVLLLSNVVQNAIIGPDNSVTGGAFGAMVLLLVNALLVRAAARYEWLGRAFEGSPTVLAREGRWQRRTLRHLGLRQADLDMAVQRQGGDRVGKTKLVTLEPGGALQVRLRRGALAADKSDVAALNAALTRLERRLDEAGIGTRTADQAGDSGTENDSPPHRPAGRDRTGGQAPGPASGPSGA